MVADVSDATQVQAVADAAVAAYGRIDTWVNLAGVALFAPFEHTTAEEFRRIVEGTFDPRTGRPFESVADVLQTMITYNLARPNEKFLGYVDGEYRYQSRIEAPVLLSRDTAFTAQVGSLTESTWGSYDSGAGRGCTG